MEGAPSLVRLTGILNELYIGYVDLLPSFRKIMRNDGLDLFRRSDKHWNEKGHNVAAKIVHSALIDEELLPPFKKIAILPDKALHLTVMRN